MISIMSIDENNPALITQVATVLNVGFMGISDAWRTLDAAYAEVITQSQPPHISLVALHAQTVVGWVAAAPQYNGHAWELHPLVVAPSFRRRGIARTLVMTLVDTVRARGATTLFVWCDDETGNTSLARTNLYPEPLTHATQFRATFPHASVFYQNVGFALCGVLPDANGIGKPDVLFARRL